MQIYFTDDSLEFGLSRRELKDGVEAGDIELMMPGEEEEAYDYTSTHFSLSFDGARATVPVGSDMAETVLNYGDRELDLGDDIRLRKTSFFLGKAGSCCFLRGPVRDVSGIDCCDRTGGQGRRYNSTARPCPPAD